MNNINENEAGIEDDDSYEFDGNEENAEDWMTVYTTNTEIEADMYKANLEGADIPVQILSQSDSAITLTYGDLAVVKILVPESYAEDALAIIEEINKDSNTQD